VDSSWKLTDMQWAIVPWGCTKLLQWIAAFDGKFAATQML
jgi:hypothetical protein